MARTTTWTGSGRTTSWFASGNWTNATPRAHETASFNDGGVWSVDLSGMASARAGALTIAGDTLTLAGGTLDLAATGGSPDLTVDDGASLTIARDATVNAGIAIVLGATGTFPLPETIGAIIVAGVLRTGTLDAQYGSVAIATGGVLNATTAIDLGTITDTIFRGTLSIAGHVDTPVLNDFYGVASASGTGARLTTTDCHVGETLSILDGAKATAAQGVDLGNPQTGRTGTLLVAGAGSRFSAGSISNNDNSDGALIVEGGGRLSADTIMIYAPNGSGHISITGAHSSVATESLIVGTVFPPDGVIDVAQGGSLSVGTGGFTLERGDLMLDASAHLTTPSLTSLAGTIASLAEASHPGDVILTAPVALGYDPYTNAEVTQVSSQGGSTLRLDGVVTGQAGAILEETGGHVVLTDSANSYGATELSAGLLEVSQTGAAGAGSLTFIGGNNAGSVLQIDTGVTFANSIAGFSVGDTIDLAGFQFDWALSSSLADGTLTLSNGTSTASLTFSGHDALKDFVLQSDHHGGTTIGFHG